MDQDDRRNNASTLTGISLHSARRVFDDRGYPWRQAVLACGGVLAAGLFLSVARAVPFALILLLFMMLGGIFLLLWREQRNALWRRQSSAEVEKIANVQQRILRDLARQRQDIAHLRETLGATGASLHKQTRMTLAETGQEAETPEHRMLRAIARQLEQMGAPLDDPAGDEGALSGASMLDIAVLEQYARSGAAAARLTDVQVLDVVRAAVAQDRIDLFVQPIVRLPQRKVRFYEALSRIRIRDGVHLPAERYVTVPLVHEMLPAIDNLLLLRTLQALRRTAGESEEGRIAYFCNITGLTLHDEKFMADLSDFIGRHQALAGRLVFELSQRDLMSLRQEALSVLAGLAHLGCRFSMDKVEVLSFSAEDLSARFIRFIKVDIKVLRAAMKVPGGREKLQRMRDALSRSGVDLIASKVERESQVVDLLDLGVEYGQGYLFAEPRPEQGQL